MQTPDTPQLSPIEKAIKELMDLISTTKSIQLKCAYQKAVNNLKLLRPYERQYLRDVAEEAWDACIRKQTFDKDSEGNPIPDKQTYLNQKHPL